jgi:hydrogenase expression/formation protein HypD
MLEEGRWGVENQYARAVDRDGNTSAQALVGQVFEITDRPWRGIGPIPASGLSLREAYGAFDAETRFGVEGVSVREPKECRAGEVLRGLIKPPECPSFGTRCTPRTPLGAPMVSSEGACAAYHQYARLTV